MGLRAGLRRTQEGGRLPAMDRSALHDAPDPVLGSVADNRAGAAAHRALQARVDGSSTVRDVEALQAALENAPAQRKTEYNAPGKKLVKIGRWDFTDRLQKAMPVGAGQHRAHTVSYDAICAAVVHPINLALAASIDANAMEVWLRGILDSVYPNGPTANGPKVLKDIAKDYYAGAAQSITDIKAAIHKGDTAALNTAANELIKYLNSSPDNLRIGHGETNSSIGQALDLTQTGHATLPAGTKIQDAAGAVTALAKPLTVLRVTQEHEIQVERVLYRTTTETGIVYLYSGGHALQSSDVAAMTSGSMSSKNPTPVAIKLSNGNFRLFQIS